MVAEPFRGAADLARLRPLEPGGRSPLRRRGGAAGAPGAAGTGVALIGFAGAPFTVASYLVEGGPSRTFAQVKALMHAEPGAVGPADGPAGRHGRGLAAAQVAAGAQAVQLFDSWAGSLSPAEYARFALPATRAVLTGVADLGVPTILFGVGTGELLALMASAGVRRRRRRLAGAARRGPPPGRPGVRVQGNLDPALVPGPLAGGRAAGARGGAGRGRATARGTGHVFNLGHGVLPETDPGILAAVVDLVHAGDRAARA